MGTNNCTFLTCQHVMQQWSGLNCDESQIQAVYSEVHHFYRAAAKRSHRCYQHEERFYEQRLRLWKCVKRRCYQNGFQLLLISWRTFEMIWKQKQTNKNKKATHGRVKLYSFICLFCSCCHHFLLHCANPKLRKTQSCIDHFHVYCLIHIKK